MNDILTKSQTTAFKVMLQGYNVFLTGGAGTGKSFVIDKYIEYLKSHNRNVMTTAPTGIAALNINGVTVHRAFGVPVKPLTETPEKINKNLKYTDVIIIDEISMCRIDLFEYIMKMIIADNLRRRKEYKKDIQVIVVGDFFQLPPVIPKKDKDILDDYYENDVKHGYAFQSKYWHYMRFIGINLNEIVRQKDLNFAASLNQVRIGNYQGFQYICNNYSKTSDNKAITVCGKNSVATEINNRELGKIQSKSKVYRSKITGDVKESDKATVDELELRVGARVMTLINDPYTIYQNGSLGTVVRLDKNKIEVAFDSGLRADIEVNTWEIKKYTFINHKLHEDVIGTFSQIPVKLAYAITVYKSQGQTFDAVNIVPDCWEPGQFYTAVSRCKYLETMHFTKEPNRWSMKTAQEVIDFYKGNVKFI